MRPLPLANAPGSARLLDWDLMRALGRFLFWEYPRASWQYDVMVALILIFIFVTPLYVNFRDQPKAASVVMLPPQQGSEEFLIEARLLAGVPPAEQAARATELVRARYKSRQTIQRVEPLLNDEEEIIGYRAFANQ
jgi:hypothetical protein